MRFPYAADGSTDLSVTTLTSNIALWLERRLDCTLGFHLERPRLYGVVLNDPLALLDEHSAAGRVSFVEEGDLDDLLHGPSSVLVRSFDAAAVVVAGWARPLASHPSQCGDESMRLVRVVTVVNDDGCACVVRFEDSERPMVTTPTCIPDESCGELVIDMLALWDRSLVKERLNPRQVVAGCTRRP